MEIFLDPQPVAPRIAIVGDTPIARALAAIAARRRLRRRHRLPSRTTPRSSSPPTARTRSPRSPPRSRPASSTSRSSPRPSAAPPCSASLDEALRVRVHTPAGLDIGARTPADIAISILAQLIAQRTVTPPAAAVESAIDPICGMEVLACDETVHLDIDGERVYFCCEGCRSAYVH